MMWAKFDHFRNWLIRKSEEFNFFVFLLILLAIPGAGMLVDYHYGLRVFGPSIIGFYATMGILAQIRDLILLKEKHQQEDLEWKRKNLPPLDGF